MENKKSKIESIAKIFENKKFFKIGIIGSLGEGKSRFLNYLLSLRLETSENEKENEVERPEGPFGDIASGKAGTTFPVEIRYHETDVFRVKTLFSDNTKKEESVKFPAIAEIRNMILKANDDENVVRMKVKGPFEELNGTNIVLVDLPGLTEKNFWTVTKLARECDSLIIYSKVMINSVFMKKCEDVINDIRCLVHSPIFFAYFTDKRENHPKKLKEVIPKAMKQAGYSKSVIEFIEKKGYLINNFSTIKEIYHVISN